MEKNIHDDRLEDYVRKSFEDYEEPPASDMWERIEVDIVPPPVQEPDRRRIRPLFWQLSTAAAILLLLSGLVCGRLYYENRIRQITTQQQEKTEPKQAPATPPSPTLSQSNIAIPAPEKPVGRNNPTEAISKSPDHLSGQKTNTLPFKTHTPTLSDIPPGNLHKPATANDPSGVVTENRSSGPEHFTVAHPSVTEPDRQSPRAPIVDNQATPAPQHQLIKNDLTSLKINNIDPLLTESIPYVFKNYTLDLPIIQPVTPKKSSSRWYLGLHTTPVLLVDKPGPERSGTLRPRLVSTQEKTTFSADYWLKLGKKGMGIWGFESGLGYRTLERNATHAARFRLSNGRPNTGGGAQERSYDFDYDLDTYGGSAEVTLRMDQVDPGAVIPDSEPLRIQVKTSERIALLRVPALATARFGRHRLQAVFKAGLVGNVVLINELDIVTRASENIRFRPAQGSNAYTLHPDRAGKVFPGYQFSAGLEYRSSQHLSWVLEPALAGDFARKNSAGRQLPGILTFGVNAGVNYWF